MSKPFPTDQPIVHLPPTEQVKLFADTCRASVSTPALFWLEATTQELGLSFTADELWVIAALDTPAKVQDFLNTQIYYNNDHATVELEETAFPPRRVLQTGLAHCFEGALFAYAVNFLHGYNPHLVLVEASQDSEHNLVVWHDAATGLYGCNAHSAFPHLDGRPAQYPTLQALVESYAPYYYSDRTMDPADLTIVGYSDEFDLVARFGVEWIAADAPLWEIYYTYIDDTWRFHYLFDDPGTPHLYSAVRALKENWLRVGVDGTPFVSVSDLPPTAQMLWHAFWRAFGTNDGRRPQGDARAIEKEFMRLTGTTPIDLEDNASDLQYFLAAGYRVEQIIHREPES